MTEAEFFSAPTQQRHRQYEALRAFYTGKHSAAEVAKMFNYKRSTVYSLIRDFKKRFDNNEYISDYFFCREQRGRKLTTPVDSLKDKIILLRKKYLSVPDIKVILDTQNSSISERHIHRILQDNGFAKLPRRCKIDRQTEYGKQVITAPKSQLIVNKSEKFQTKNAGLLLFISYIKQYSIDKLIEESLYPGTKQIPKLNSILAFIALKLSNVSRYTSDDLWCMDRGSGLFSGLNVLPKAGWYSSYSSRVTREMNISFLRAMHKQWHAYQLLSDTVNMDFVAVPYWGNSEHLEKNWSGTRRHALTSVLAALAEDPDSGMITYGDANVRHENESDVSVEFLDFYKESCNETPKYLVFDSKFTTYQNLSKLDDDKIRFITIRRRGKKIVEELLALPKEQWKTTRVPTSNGKIRTLTIYESTIKLSGYGKQKDIRQIAIQGHGKIKPALIISNDFTMKTNDVVRKYAQRWLVEKTISEQTHFFHLNRLSSSMVIKVDFDLTMSILAYNLYRLMAADLTGFNKNTAKTLYDKFIANEGHITCDDQTITVNLKKKRTLPLLLEAMQGKSVEKISWLGDRKVIIAAAATT